MKRLIHLFFLGLLCSFSSSSDNETRIREKLKNYLFDFRQEKAYLHLDKQYYSSGETIWFKGYVIDAQQHSLIPVSSLLNVELFNSNGKLVANRKLNIKEGSLAGEILLPDSLASGQYLIRAYTNWMKNFDKDYFFTKELEIIDFKNEKDSVKRVEREIRIQFFPEGGELIDGISSIVGFKITDQFGNGIEAGGTLKMESGMELAKLNSNHLGMGKFVLNPSSEEKYLFKLNAENLSVAYDFPEVKDEGYALKMIHSFTSESVLINIAHPNTDLNGVLIIGHQRGKIFTSLVYNGDGKSFTTRLNKKVVPPGICHFTLFDKQGVPRAERLAFFRYDENELLLSAEFDESFEKREEADFFISIRDSTSSLASANASISITPRETVRPQEWETNIVNYLDVSSDLNGKIESPGYYLKRSKENYTALDDLLLTQGWRRFTWEQVLEDKRPKIDHLIESGFTVSGKMVHKYNPEKVVSGVVSITYESGGLNFFEVDTDETGRFTFYNIDIPDSTDVIVQARREKGKNDKLSDDVTIRLDSIYQPVLEHGSHLILFKEKEEVVSQEFIEQANKIDQINAAFDLDEDATLLSEVAIVGYREKENDPLFRAGTLHGEPSNRVVLDSIGGLQGFRSPLEILRRVPGVRLSGGYPNYNVSVQGQGSTSSNTPLFLLDGQQVGLSSLSSLSIADISHIDVLKGGEAAMYGSQAANGVIAFYTRVGMGPVKFERKGIMNFRHPGYYQAREFFVPNYEISLPEHAKPDIRSTLYWNPNIQFEEGKVSFSFYTSDQVGLFDIRIEGITNTGRPFVDNFTMKVK